MQVLNGHSVSMQLSLHKYCSKHVCVCVCVYREVFGVCVFMERGC